MFSQKDFNNLLITLTSQKNVPAIIQNLQQIHQYVEEEMVGDPTKLTLSHMQRLYGALNRLQIFNEETIQYWIPIVQILFANKLPEKIFLHYYIQKVFSFFTIYRNFQEHKTIINLCFELLLKLSDGIIHTEDPTLDLNKEYSLLISLIKNLQLNNPSNNTMDHFPSICKVFSKYLLFFPREEVLKDTYFWIGISLTNIISDHKNIRDSGQLVVKALLTALSEFSDKINNQEQSSKLHIKEDRLKELLKPRAADPENEWANLLKLFIQLAENLLQNSSVFINIIFFSLLEGFKIQGERERELSIECWLRALPLLIKTPHLDAKKRTHILEIIFTNFSYNKARPHLVKLQLNSIWYLIKTYQMYEKDYTEILQDFLLKLFGSHVSKKGKELNINRNKNLCPQEYCNELTQYLAFILDVQPGSPKPFLWTTIPPATKTILSYNHLSRLTPQIIHCVLVTLDSNACKEEDSFEIQDFICSNLIKHLIDEKVLKIYPEGLKRLFRSMITILLKCKDQPKIRPILLNSILKRIIHQVPTQYLFSVSHSLVVHQQGGLATPIHFFLEILLCNMFIELPQAKPLIDELINLLSNSDHCLELVSTLSRVFNQDLQEKRSDYADRCIIQFWKKLPELVIKNQFNLEILKDSSIEILSTPLQRLNFIPLDEQSAVLDIWRVYLDLSLKTHADIFITFSERLISIIPWSQLKDENLELSTRFLLVFFDNYSQNQAKSLTSKDLNILVQLLERAMALSIDETENKNHHLTIDNLCKCLANLLNFIDHSHLSIVCNSFCGFIIETLTRATDGPLLLLWEKFFKFIENGIKEINSSEIIFAISELCQKAVNAETRDLAIKTKIFLEYHLIKNFPDEKCVSSIKIPDLLLLPQSDDVNISINDDEVIPSSQPITINKATGQNFGSSLSKIANPPKRILRTPKPKEYSDYEIFPSFKRTRERKVSKDNPELNDNKNIDIKEEKIKLEGVKNKKIKSENDSNSLEKLNETLPFEISPYFERTDQVVSPLELSKNTLKIKNPKNFTKVIDSTMNKLTDNVEVNNSIENIGELSKNIQTTINSSDVNLENHDSDSLIAAESSKEESSQDQEKINSETIEEKINEPNNETDTLEKFNENNFEDQCKEKVQEKPLEEKINEEPLPSTSDKKDIGEEKFHCMKLTGGLRAAIMVAMSKNLPLPEASTSVIQPDQKKTPKANRLFVGYNSPRAAKMLEMAKEQDGKYESCELDQMELLNHSFETLDQRQETPSVPIKKSRRTRRIIPKSGNIIKNISPQIKKLIVSDKESDIQMNYVDWNPPPSPHPDSIPQRSALRQNKTKTPSKGVRFLKSEVSNLLVFTYSDHNDSIERFQEVLDDVKGKYKDSDSKEKNSESNNDHAVDNLNDSAEEDENLTQNNKSVENNSETIHTTNQEENQLEEELPTQSEENLETQEIDGKKHVLENNQSINEDLKEQHEENYPYNNEQILEIKEELHFEDETYQEDLIEEENFIDSNHQLIIKEEPQDEMSSEKIPEPVKRPKKMKTKLEVLIAEAQKATNIKINSPRETRMSSQRTTRSSSTNPAQKILKKSKRLKKSSKINKKDENQSNKNNKEISSLNLISQEVENVEGKDKDKETEKEDTLETYEEKTISGEQIIENNEETAAINTESKKNSTIQQSSSSLQEKENEKEHAPNPLENKTKNQINKMDLEEPSVSTTITKEHPSEDIKTKKHKYEHIVENSSEDKSPENKTRNQINKKDSQEPTDLTIVTNEHPSEDNKSKKCNRRHIYENSPEEKSQENKTKNQINKTDSQEPTDLTIVTNEHPSEDNKSKKHKYEHIVENSSEDISSENKTRNQINKKDSQEPTDLTTITNEHPSEDNKSKKRNRRHIDETSSEVKSLENKTKNQINKMDLEEPSVSTTITNEHPSEDNKTKKRNRRHVDENSSEDKSQENKTKNQINKKNSQEPTDLTTVTNEHSSEDNKTKKGNRRHIVETSLEDKSPENKTRNQINKKDSQEPTDLTSITTEHPSEDNKSKKGNRRHIDETSSEDKSQDNKTKNQINKKDLEEPSNSTTITNEHPPEDIKTKKRKRGHKVEINSEDESPENKTKDHINKNDSQEPSISNTMSKEHSSEVIKSKKRKRRPSIVENNPENTEQAMHPIKRGRRSIKDYFNQSLDKINNPFNNITSAQTSTPNFKNNLIKKEEIKIKNTESNSDSNDSNKTPLISQKRKLIEEKENLSEKNQANEITTEMTGPADNEKNIETEKENGLSESRPELNMNIQNKLNKYRKRICSRTLSEENEIPHDKENLPETWKETLKENIPETSTENSLKENLSETSKENSLKENLPETSKENLSETLNSLNSTISCEIDISDDDEIEIVHVSSSVNKSSLSHSPQKTQEMVVIPAESETSNNPFSWLNSNPNHILYEKLKDSTEPIETIIPRLFCPVGPQNSEKIAQMSIKLKYTSLKTIGDLAKLTISQVKNLPIPQPKVILALHTLKCFDNMPQFKVKELQKIFKIMRSLSKENRIHLLSSLIAEFPEVAYDYVTPYSLIKSLPNFLSASEILFPFMLRLRKNKSDNTKFIVPILRTLMKKFNHKTVMNSLILAYPKDDIINDFNNHSLVKQILDHQAGQSPKVREDSSVPFMSEENNQITPTNENSTTKPIDNVTSLKEDSTTKPIDNVTSLNEDSTTELIEIDLSLKDDSTIELNENDLSLNDDSTTEPMEVENEIETNTTENQISMPDNNFFLTSLNPEVYLQKSENFTLEQFEQIQHNIIQILSLTHNKIQTLKTNNTSK